ncbi:alpha/beta hydrolase family protein [Kocuria sp.]|uniref:alpha/beta hydrolase n=1 Tax=Kocuria sp. TaxID=1871328 RepID=UPI0026DD85C6|nr:alpha/beta hydrolase-fold protein [Kocuria sp.]MDO4919821.1 alpha/beta hydrolase-fold protein [Kocuria sp.]
MTGHRTHARGARCPAVLRAVAATSLTAVLLTACGTGQPEPAATTTTAMGFDAQAVKQAGFEHPEQLRQQADGITVTAARGLSQRAVELEVTTDAVSRDAPGGRNSVVVVTPENYDPARKYPVVYMLPGSGAKDAPALQWYEAGQAEQVSAGLPVITVIVSGGEQGWYTNWADQEEMTQNWETFHLDQVVPWVDSHLSTAADRDHRLVLGNSMGGYGAVRYAEDRPDLFAEAVSLSGLLDLSSEAARDNLLEASKQVTGKWNSVFGNGATTTDEQWDAHDPLVQSGKLQDVRVQLFAGTGNGQDGDIEPALRDSTAALARELDSRGVSHQYTEYGAAGSCDGGHTFECWRPAATVALGRWADRLKLQRTATQPAVDPQFEHITSGTGS